MSSVKSHSKYDIQALWLKASAVLFTRFSPAILLSMILRIFGAVWIHSILTQNGEFTTFWMKIWADKVDINYPGPPDGSWVYLFHAWDSGFYVTIARAGYQYPKYVFLPAYPILIRIVGYFSDFWLSALVVSLFFSLAMVVMFQLIAEMYMDHREALFATMLFLTFPYVMFFTTLAYTESLFLFSSLAAWYYYRKGSWWISSLMAGIASLTKIYGVAIVLPMLVNMIRKRQYNIVRWLTIPLGSLGAWFFYCYLASRDWLASWSNQEYWLKGGLRYGLIQDQVLPSLLTNINPLGSFVPLFVVVMLFSYLIVKVWTVDRELWVYSVALFSALLVSASIISLPRYCSFIFPLWLTVRVRSPLAVVVCILVFVPFGFMLWISALRGIFVT